MGAFDDFLGLAARDFSRHRALVFSGESGSGKSTAIAYLRERHRDLAGRALRVVDEARTADLPRLWRRIARGERLLVASHLPAWLLRAALPFAGVAVFRTDRDCPKIARYLKRRGIFASEAAVEAYVRRYGATYTDADLILERFPGLGFDAALARFGRLCRLERTARRELRA